MTCTFMLWLCLVFLNYTAGSKMSCIVYETCIMYMSLRFLQFCPKEWFMSSFGAEDMNYYL